MQDSHVLSAIIIVTLWSLLTSLAFRALLRQRWEVLKLFFTQAKQIPKGQSPKLLILT